MVITPNSRIILLKSPLKLDHNNQLTFENATDQYNYFYNLPKLEHSGFTYVRKDGVIRIPTHTVENDGLPTYEDLLGYNYCMYQNTAYTSINKWFYAYITDVSYQNDGMTSISIETDVWQTWQFNLVYMDSYIERQHVTDDTIGANTLPENIDTGDFISCKLQPSFTGSLETCYVVACTELPSNISSYATLNQSIPIGLYYIGLTELFDIQQLIKVFDTDGKKDAVNAVFVIPKAFFSNWTALGTGFTGQYSTTVSFEYSSPVAITRPNYIGNDYVPKNNKLFTYPYSFLQVSNHTGQVVNYKWENFNLLAVGTTGYNFSLKGTITPGGSFKLLPVNYNNILNNNDDTISLGKYPIGAWSNDIYTNWLTQNGVNLGFTTLNAREAGLAIGGVQTGIGALQMLGGSESGIGTAFGGLGRIVETLQSDYRHSMIPDSVSGNTNTGDVNFVYGLNNLEFKRMSIKNEYAFIIDNYFSMFGYKVNRLAKPYVRNRTNWDYIKCIDVNLEGDVPEKDLDEIRSLFNNGCTFWHTTTYFLDYSRTNAIA